jgi:hypothetical protein
MREYFESVAEPCFTLFTKSEDPTILMDFLGTPSDIRVYLSLSRSDSVAFSWGDMSGLMEIPGIVLSLDLLASIDEAS